MPITSESFFFYLFVSCTHRTPPMELHPFRLHTPVPITYSATQSTEKWINESNDSIISIFLSYSFLSNPVADLGRDKRRCTFGMSTACRYNLIGLGLQGFTSIHKLALTPDLEDRELTKHEQNGVRTRNKHWPWFDRWHIPVTAAHSCHFLVPVSSSPVSESPTR